MPFRELNEHEKDQRVEAACRAAGAGVPRPTHRRASREKLAREDAYFASLGAVNHTERFHWPWCARDGCRRRVPHRGMFCLDHKGYADDGE